MADDRELRPFAPTMRDKPTSFRTVLRRHRSRLVYLMENLEAKGERLAKANQKLLTRRRFYRAKNNGRGRPPKPLRTLSREDTERREIYQARLGVIDSALACPSTMALADWLRQQRLLRDAEDAIGARQIQKIDQLLAQLAGRIIRINWDRAWSDKSLREFLLISRQRQRGRLGYFADHPPRTARALEAADRERARFYVLSRFLDIKLFPDFEYFVRRADLIRAEPQYFNAIHNRDTYRQDWKRCVEALLDEAKTLFVVSERAQ